MKKASAADFPRFEEEMLKTWDQERTFEQSIDNRKAAPRFSFYDGPPFANGLPHYGHVVALTEKDSITRYKTMRGYYVPRRNGWDTHGLPVETEVEKQLGIKGKRDILDMGAAKFNDAARASVFKYKGEWEQFMTRLGRWSDQENSYATLDDDYIESVWWVLGQLHQKGLVYRGFRSNPYCPRCATPLSNFEVNQNYQDDVPDPSVYVKFQLASDPNTSLLAWTTTPWTLPANAALAVDAKAEYVTVELTADGDGWRRGERLILAKGRLSELELRQAEYKVVEKHKGGDLAGQRYRPLYTFTKLTAAEEQTVYTVYIDDSVSLEDGTGVLHVAPRYGETDLALGQREKLPLIESVDGFGHMTGEMGSFAGQWFKEADRHIIEDLTKQGRIFAAEIFNHTYPFCWRCDTPLMYFALETWYVKVTDLRERLVANNEKIKWVPDHIKSGRFGHWLAEARDWNFSRNRFWGAPIPIWINEKDPEDIIVVSSLEELRQLSGVSNKIDLHRPGIDEIVINKDGKTYRRAEEVFDCWFESGAMPYAQDHYPFEHQGDFKDTFPASFIAEGLDQTRGWFYTLHVLGAALFDQPAFKNVVVNGLVLAADGKKLSKRLRNYPDTAEVFRDYGADSLRYFLMSSPVVSGEDVRFSAEAVREVNRNIFARLWNVYSFLTTYAEVDGWQPPKKLAQPKAQHVLDRWIVARLNQTIQEVTSAADDYQIARATRPIRDLIDDLSNWYVRRSRRRFWKSDDDSDKQQAYATLHYVLTRLAQLLAPWSPFVADVMWRGLTEGCEAPKSVHLSDWPEAGKVDDDLLRQMSLARSAIVVGLAQRAEAKIKVRQPLQTATVWDTLVIDDNEVTPFLINIIKDELNVKSVVLKRGGDQSFGEMVHEKVELDTNITPDLKREGMVRDLIRQIQNQRKQLGLEVDDRINLVLQPAGDELAKAIDEHTDLIKQETLATSLKIEPGGSEPDINLSKA